MLFGQCPPASPLATPLIEPFTSVPVGVSGTLSNCWIAGSGAAAAFRWETENSNGANENSLATGPFFDNTTPSTIGGMYIYLETSSGVANDSAFFTSPDIDLTPLSNPELSFAYHMYGATMGNLFAQVWDGTSWNTEVSLIGQQQAAGNTPWNIVTIPLTSYSGTIKVRFKGTRGTSFTGDMSIDDISIANPQACPSPSLLTATQIGAYSATLGWTPGNSGATWNIEYGPTGFTLGTGTLVSNHSSTSLALTGLNSSTSYVAYVTENCLIGGTSNTVGPVSFSTLCAPFVAPFTEDFSGIPIGIFLDYGNCWTVPGTSTPRWESEDASGANENSLNTGPFYDNTTFGTAGGTYMYLETSSGAAGGQGSLISGQFDVTALTAPYVEFYYHMYGATIGTLFVDVLDTNSTWLNLLSVVGQQQTSGGAPWIKTGASVPLYISVANTGIIQFRVRGQRGTSFDGDMSIDDFSVIEAPACPDPTSFFASNITGTSADFSFNSNSTSFNIEWGPVGFSQGTGTLSLATTSPATVTGLAPNTSYSAYIQADCGVNGTSTWVGPINFTTSCATVSIPYLQDFNSWPPSCVTLTGGTQTFANSLVGGNSYAFANFWGWTSGNWARMITPEIAISVPAQVKVDWSHLYSGTYPLDQMLVMIQASSPGAPIDTLINLVGPTFTTPGAANTAPTSGSFSQSIAFIPSSYVGQNARVTVRGNSGFGPSLYIDNLIVEAVPLCPDPTNITAANITGTTADISWSFGGTASGGWTIEWGPQGFGQGSGTIVNSSTIPATITGLQPLSSYSVYVQQNCGTNGLSSWAGPYSFTTACTAFSAPYFEDFENLPQAPGAFLDYGNCWNMPNLTTPRWETELATGVNTNSLATGPFFDHSTFGTAGGTYFYFETSGGTTGSTNELITANVDVSTLTTPYVEFWYHMYGATTGTLGLDVWNSASGWTNDIILLVGQQQTAGSDPWSKVGAVLPAGYNGVVRFRFRGIRGTSFTGDISIDDFSVEEAPLCPDVSSIVGILIQGNQANIGWNGQGGTNFNIEWGPAGFGQGSGTVLTSSTDSVLITGLTATTSYDVYVQNSCGINGLSGWTGPFTFTTTVTCPAPSAVIAAASTSSISYSWQTGGANNFNYVFGPSGTTPLSGTILSGTGSSITVPGLNPSTSYAFWIRDSCGPADVSTWVGPINANTLCVTASMPYLRDFDGANFPPLCWDLTGGTQTLAQNGSDYLFANFWGWTSGNWARATTEPIFINQDARVRFNWSHLYSGTYPLDQMLLMVRLANSTTLDTLVNLVGPTFTTPGAANTAPAPAGNFIQESINLDPAIYTGQDVVFMLRFNSGFGPSVYVDDFIVEALPACPQPTSLSVASTTSNSASVSWTNGSTAASTWFVEYGPTGFMPGNGTTVTVTSNPTVINGLSPSTQYSWYVRELCPNGVDTSSYSVSSSFSTLCGAITAPYLQTFTGLAAGLVGTYPTSLSLVNCWDLGGTQGGQRWETEDASGANENSLATGPWFDNTTPSVAGGMYIYLETSTGVSTSGPAMFTSPEIVTSSLTIPNLSFAYHMYGATMDTLRVDVFSNGSWNVNVFALFGQQQTAGNSPWLIANVPLSSFGDTIRVRFAGRRGSSFTGDISLDDIRVDEAPACPNPISLSVASTSTTSATVSWTAGSPTATTWFVEVGAPGFAIGSGTFSTATAIPYTISGLNASGNYCFYVYEQCANGDTSLAAGPVCFTTQCGTASIPYLRDFNTWAPICWDLTGGTQTFAQFNNTMMRGNFWGWTSGNNARATTEPIQISQDAQVEFDWSHLYSATYPIDQLLVLAQIQGSTSWDTLVDFIGPSFTVGGAGNTTPAASLAHHIVALDPAVYTGQTIQLRIIGNSGFGPDVFIDNFAVNPYSTCPAPTNLSSNTVTLNSANLTWTAGSTTASTYYVEYGLNGFVLGTGSIVASSTASLSLTGLSSGTNYCAYVSELCSGGDTSAYSAPVCFTTTGTPPSCLPPTALNATVTCSSINLAWTNPTSNSIVQWGPAGFALGTGSVASAIVSSTLTGLSPNTAYDLYVAAICANGDTSAFSNKLTATTASGPLPNIQYTQNITSVTLVDATVQFNASATTNGTSYLWDFGNGTSANTAIATATYLQNGNYSVTLTVSNDCGSVDVVFTIALGGISLEEGSTLENSIRIYPIPSKEYVNIEFMAEQSEQYTIELVNYLGQTLMVQSIVGSESLEQIQLNVSELPKGVYFVRIQNEQSIISRKIQKN